jgi:signal transduction histidine kinase
MSASPGATPMRRRHILLAGLMPAVLCAALALYPPAFVTRFDLNVYDALLRFAGTDSPTGRVVIVDVDERSVSTIGQWPWRRDVIAELVGRLRSQGADSVALNILFSEADRQSDLLNSADATLAKTLREGRVVLGYAFTFGEAGASSRQCVLHPLRVTVVQPDEASGPPLFAASGALCSLPTLAEAAGASGFLNGSPDPDGILRRVPIALEFQGQVYPALALQAMMATSEPHVVLQAANANTTSLTLGSQIIPLDGRSNLLLRYRGQKKTFPYVSAADVLAGATAADAFAGKVVFVGATALGTQELVATPFDPVFAGVEVQATIADNLLRGDFLRRPEHGVALQALITLALGLGMGLTIRRVGVVWGVFAALAGLGVMWGMCAWLMDARGVFLSPLVPTAGIVSSLAAVAFATIATELRTSFAELQKARRATEEASHAKSEFLMNVSHELRTPLNAIYGSAKMLATGVLKDEQKSKALATIERNTRAQTQLIDDLVNASETAGGKLRLDVKDVDLAGVVRSVLDSVRPAIQAKRITLQAAIDDGLGLIRGDRDRLQQVVWHLLSNAIKFTPMDGGLAIHLERTKTSAQLTVNDSGTGIAPAFLPHVFEPFRQQDGSTTRQYGGLGLGLSLVREIVELHGGSIAVDSDGVGRGTTVRVQLPLAGLAKAHAREPRADDGSTVPRA